MRIWSLHPKYLDSKGLVALWRETLLAKKVLEGKTKGYINHPQLHRFRSEDKPVELINQYLSSVFYEAESRGYCFDRTKIDWNFSNKHVQVTDEQMNFEKQHLLKKLKNRDLRFYNVLKNCIDIEQHPIFIVKKGSIERWEIQ